MKSLLEANKAVKIFQFSTFRLVYLDLGNPEDLKVILYRDVNHADLPSCASQGVQIVFLCDNKSAVLITWKPRKIERVTKCPVASETISLSELADKAILFH